MAYEGFLRFGGNEVANNERARSIASTADCPMSWLKGPRCTSLAEALGDNPYSAAALPDAPWFDPSSAELSGRFYGVFILGISGLKDSTRSASVVESIDDGAVIGRSRKSSRQVRVKAILVARGSDALSYGAAWLSASLDADACGQHGTGCGSTDLEYFTACPPARGSETDDEYAGIVNAYRRFLHGVAVTSGPYERDLYNVGDFWGQVFEWTYTAGRPWVYSATVPVDLPVTPTIVIQDTPYNLAKYPSAELPGSAVVVATNYSTNPSVETNATRWIHFTAVSTGASPASRTTSGRVTGELSAVGSSSFRVRLLGNGSTAESGGTDLVGYQEVEIPSTSDTRFSVNVWGAAIISAGASASTISRVRALLEWKDSGGSVLGTVQLGDSPNFGGNAWTLSGLLPPAGATVARISVRATVTWASSATPANNSDIRLYVDALALTIP